MYTQAVPKCSQLDLFKVSEQVKVDNVVSKQWKQYQFSSVKSRIAVF